MERLILDAPLSAVCWITDVGLLDRLSDFCLDRGKVKVENFLVAVFWSLPNRHRFPPMMRCRSMTALRRSPSTSRFPAATSPWNHSGGPCHVAHLLSLASLPSSYPPAEEPFRAALPWSGTPLGPWPCRSLQANFRQGQLLGTPRIGRTPHCLAQRELHLRRSFVQQSTEMQHQGLGIS